jgi:late competence protein required for DNA uptake (superfamily II DNA/RNA helicase)
MLSEDDIKQIFFRSDEDRDDPLMADEVDILQFAHNIELAVAEHYARKERTQCVNFVRSLNPRLAQALAEKRKS